jgi:hypothetical protein
MHKSSSTHAPFAELSTEARTLFFLNALAALARYGAQRPRQSDIAEQLEVIWNRNRFVVSDLSNPHRMTDILKAHFAAPPTTSGCNATGQGSRTPSDSDSA